MLRIKKEYLSDLNIKVLDAVGLSYEENEEYIFFDEESESDILNAQKAGNLFSGFLSIPMKEYTLFFLKNQDAIIAELKEWADEQGEELLEMISNFNNMKEYSISQIGEALFTRLSEKEIKEYEMDLIPDNELFEIREGLGVAIFEDFLIFNMENYQEEFEE